MPWPYPRFTKDMDVFFEASPGNITRLRTVLIAFGFVAENLPEEAFMTEGNVLAFGVAPSRVVLLNAIDGVRYADAKPNMVRGTYGGINTHIDIGGSLR